MKILNKIIFFQMIRKNKKMNKQINKKLDQVNICLINWCIYK